MSTMPPTPNYAGPMPGAPKPAGLAIASMVLGIISVPLFCVWYLSMPCAILAIIFGIVARGKAKRGEGGGGAMALTGLICGIVSISLFLLFLFGVLAFLGYAGKKVDEMQRQQQQGGSSLLPVLAQHTSALWNIITTMMLK